MQRALVDNCGSRGLSVIKQQHSHLGVRVWCHHINLASVVRADDNGRVGRHGQALDRVKVHVSHDLHAPVGR